MSAKEKYLSVGIDLGTSQSAISTSNAGHFVVDSYVGWPVDMVARKVVKKPVLIGADAIENRSLLDLHRPLEQGLIKEGSEKDIAAVKEILGHLIGAPGPVNRDPIAMWILLGYFTLGALVYAFYGYRHSKQRATNR